MWTSSLCTIIVFLNFSPFSRLSIITVIEMCCLVACWRADQVKLRIHTLEYLYYSCFCICVFVFVFLWYDKQIENSLVTISYPKQYWPPCRPSTGTSRLRSCNQLAKFSLSVIFGTKINAKLSCQIITGYHNRQWSLKESSWKEKYDTTASTDMIQGVKDIVDDPSGSPPGSSDRWLWRSRINYPLQSWKVN